MNEGWATYWHDRIVREMGIIKDKVFYAQSMSAILGNSKMGLNPYKLGFELFSHIKEYADMGRFDPQYDGENQVSKRTSWNTNANQGNALIKSVRESESDFTFLLKYATEDFINDKRLYIWGKEPKPWWDKESSDQYVIRSRDPNEIRTKMLQGIFQANKVRLRIVDGDYNKQGELYLKISREDEGINSGAPTGLGISEGTFFEGRPVKKKELEATAIALFSMWNRPIHIEAPLTATASSITEMGMSSGSGNRTIKMSLLSYDGKTITYTK
jgi:spore cortex formation protein SpoVR/YcgB (stage V sporulation)